MCLSYFIYRQNDGTCLRYVPENQKLWAQTVRSRWKCAHILQHKKQIWFYMWKWGDARRMIFKQLNYEGFLSCISSHTKSYSTWCSAEKARFMNIELKCDSTSSTAFHAAFFPLDVVFFPVWTCVRLQNIKVLYDMHVLDFCNSLVKVLSLLIN